MLVDHKQGTSLMLGVMLLLTVVVAPASAGQRVALVIGNGAYGDQGAMRRGLREFAAAAATARTAVVFYTGHAIALGERNFLVPVDARLLSDQDIEFEAVPLKLVEWAVSRASGVRLIILDASRPSPFASAMQMNEARGPIGPGLAGIEPSEGTLVACSAREGTVSVDGDDRNSVYSRALLRYLEEPDLSVEQLFGKVGEAVLAATGGSQEPSVYGSLSDGSAYLSPQPAPSPVAPDAATPAEDGTGEDELAAEKLAAERMYWTSVKDSDDPAELQSYLEQYPNGTYAALARIRLKRLGGAIGSTSPETSSASGDPGPAESKAETLEPEAAEEALGLKRDHRRLVQSGLALLGFDPGPADGVFGPRTRAAIAKWQASQEKTPTGYLDVEAAKILAREGNEAPPSGDQRETSRQAAMETLTEALRVTGEIEDHGNRTRALSEIGTVLAKSGDTRRAAQTLQLALAAAQRIERDWERASVLPGIAAAQASIGDGAGATKSIREALAAAQRLEDGYWRTSALSQIAAAQASAGDTQGAFATARRIEGNDARTSALSAIAKAQASAGNVRGALATTQRIEGQRSRVSALSHIARAQASGGDRAGAAQSIRRALATTQRIEDEGDRAHALYGIARGQVSAGDDAGAAESIRRALAAAQRIEDADDRVWMLSAVAEAQALVGDEAAAAQSIREALMVSRRIEDETSLNIALSQVARAQASAGDTRGALVTAQRMGYEAMQHWTIVAIASKIALLGDTQGALVTARRLDDDWPRSSALSGIAAAQLGVED